MVLSLNNNGMKNLTNPAFNITDSFVNSLRTRERIILASDLSNITFSGEHVLVNNKQSTWCI
ncbi:hypothetical protein BCR33DRAFT_713098 [Rhizoclosmatium globosum]|uniref:Uncharacterized protein n=1 Tax=Rhizoclosmatium globosum TaxID=329046 RepID=A0A1Y2CT85_9FUNG|nr:hypothetical protein BCR33DRAFT_713098 [Rhizoclosmatium globosum]|eukprot:ORY50270.1 hypothetical protein BCR33DRAFT_713098 [Rhizoclosmatium globosum]